MVTPEDPRNRTSNKEYATEQTILGPFWDNFGTSLGQFWDQCGTILGPVWDNFGTILKLFWDLATQAGRESGLPPAEAMLLHWL